MLIFQCTDCKETIFTADTENPDQVFGKIDEHIARCPLATFTFEGKTDLAKQRADDLRSAISHGRKLRLH
jgi:hypothetical protein